MPTLRPAGVPTERRHAIAAYLRTRHATTDQLARRFFAGQSAERETGRKKASRWLGKERRRRRVRVAGTVLLRGSGRPMIVYGPPCKPDLLEHQVWVTEAELLLGIDAERDVPVGQTVADGTFARDGSRFALEVDNAGKQSRRQYQQKWGKYGRFDGFILVVCHTEKRMRSVIRWAEPQKDACLFTTFDRLRRGEPWTDWYGHTATI